jgi:hypothetical protein
MQRVLGCVERSSDGACIRYIGISNEKQKFPIVHFEVNWVLNEELSCCFPSGTPERKIGDSLTKWEISDLNLKVSEEVNQWAFDQIEWVIIIGFPADRVWWKDLTDRSAFVRSKEDVSVQFPVEIWSAKRRGRSVIWRTSFPKHVSAIRLECPRVPGSQTINFVARLSITFWNIGPYRRMLSEMEGTDHRSMPKERRCSSGKTGLSQIALFQGFTDWRRFIELFGQPFAFPRVSWSRVIDHLAKL